ncbi:hypothetical protein ACS0TY_019662 [Phlomoides rotata]
MNSLLVNFGVIFSMTTVAAECEFKVVFNFGDSNSDTGGYYAAFPALHPPYGITYFKQPAGRASDGHLHMPQPDVFGKSIYTFYIGQNDFTTMLQFCSVNNMTVLLDVVSRISTTIKEIYTLGGRTFLVFNLAPLGCYPSILSTTTSNSSDIDSAGCLTPTNSAVDEYNTMLKAALSEQARKQLPADAKVVLVDSHAVLLRVFNNPTFYGFPNATAAACSGNHGAATFCSDPQHFVSWDGLHLTEAANKIVADGVLTEAYFDPPFPLSKYCDINPPH